MSEADEPQRDDDVFDDVIVGGGSAGCVFANRLSADSGRRVLLVEAGIDTPPSGVPSEILDSYPMALFHGDRYIWPGLKATVTRLPDGTAPEKIYEQARVMGGGSSINVQAANRGLPRDYDAWRDLGADGWSWQDVLPYFRRLENDLDVAGPLHGQEGPIPIRRILPEGWPAFAEAVATALDATGLPRRLDQNGEFEDGIFPPAFSNRDDRRVSTAAGYLDGPTRARRNLEIMPESTVTGLVIADGRAARVIIRRRDGSRRTVAVSGRVILAAGALQSPAILMRSGIGPAEHLSALGIDPVADRPGMGANLRDHPALTFSQVLPRHLRLAKDFRRSSLVALRYSSGLPGGTASDMYMTSSARAGWHELGSMLALHFLWVNQPHSVGSLKLASPDPGAHPLVDLNLLSDERDLARLADGVRRLARLLVSPALNANADDLFPAAYTPRIRKLSAVSETNRYATAVLARALDVPAPLRGFILKTFLLRGVKLQDILRDETHLRDFVRRSVFGVWHPSGTCRMGRPDDPLAVVDRTGRVIGTRNLFVGDASVMPRLPTANTNIPTIMVAEKLSDHLLGRG